MTLLPPKQQISILIALARTVRHAQTVTILLKGRAQRISSEHALAIVAQDPTQWDYAGTSHRVRSIWPAALRNRHLPSRPLIPWEDCYHTTLSPILQPSPEWQHRMGYAIAI